MKTRSKKNKRLPIENQTDLQSNFSLDLQPSNHTHSQQSIHLSNDLLQQTLSVGYEPKDIKCRQKEKQQIVKFVRYCLSNEGTNKSRVLYVSGVPGVGKTLSTMRVIKELRKTIHYKKATFKYINALELKSPQSIYKAINMELFKVQKNDLERKNIPLSLQNKLQADTRIKFIIIDEIDFLLTKDQAILYNLFEWSNSPKTKLCFIAIANTMDFPEKLMDKIISRMGQSRLVFKPYTYHQVQKILQQRICKSNRFSKDAITYVCKKMANYTSDIRKLLNILKQCLKQEQREIRIDAVIKNWQKINQEKGEQWQESLPEFFRRILEILKELGGQAYEDQVYQRMSMKYKTCESEVVSSCHQLSQMGLVKMKITKFHSQNLYRITLLKI